MEALTIENLTFCYPNRDEPVLKNIDLKIGRGEFAVLVGRSGSGKSTLLRQLKTALTPAGTRRGRILLEGIPLENVPLRRQAAGVGFVMQKPENQIVTDKVWHELVFGMENLGLDRETIRRRAAETATFFGIQEWFHRDVSMLSGGQKQLLNLAAVAALQPELLILDEPLAQLDPMAASEFLDAVRKLNRELGTTVLLTEQRLEEVLPLADHVIVLDGGAVLADGAPQEAALALAARSHEMFAAMPAPVRIAAALRAEGIGTALASPRNVREGRLWLTRLLQTEKVPPQDTQTQTRMAAQGQARARAPEQTDRVAGELQGNPAQAAAETEPVLSLRDVWFRYGREDADVLRDLSLDVYSGELLCLLGGNGSGKTTLLKVLAGLLPPYRGKVKRSERAGRAALLPQDPQTLFTENTVEKDLLAGCVLPTRILEAARAAEIEPLLKTHPYDLSGGEQQRAALAKVLLTEPDVLLLDEPTKGLDACFKKKLAEILKRLCAQGMTVVMVSHDVEFCAEYADRCALLFDGGLTQPEPPRKFFSGNRFYTTAANRMARHIFAEAITAEDVVRRVKEALANGGTGDAGGTNDRENEHRVGSGSPSSSQSALPMTQSAQSAPPSLPKEQSVLSSSLPAKRRSAWFTVLMFCTALGVSFAGLLLWNDRQYTLVSFLAVLCVIFSFFAAFERQRPQAREIILLSVLTALAVAGRAVFFITPNFKPMAAFAVISGLCLGPQAGFFVGAMSSFVSNFLFGQGPWTPWQMCALGAVGLFSGLLWRSGFAKRVREAASGRTPPFHGYRILPAMLGAILTFFVYGGIVDLWTLFGFYDTPTLAAALSVYGLALPYNFVHAVGTAVFLYFLFIPFADKLDRIRTKYNLYISS